MTNPAPPLDHDARRMDVARAIYLAQRVSSNPQSIEAALSAAGEWEHSVREYAEDPEVRTRRAQTVRDYLADADAALCVMYAPGDEYHTIDELYTYRMLYHAHAANEWARHGTHPVVKARRHSDGEPCFGGGWFVVVATLPGGQVSNHYRDEHWHLFDVPEVDLPPTWDGHTPAEAAERLHAALTGAVARA